MRSELILENATSDQDILCNVGFNSTSSQFDNKYVNSNLMNVNIIKDFIFAVWGSNVNSEYDNVESKLTSFRNLHYSTEFNPIQFVEPQPDAIVGITGITGIVSSEQYPIFDWNSNLNTKKDELIRYRNAYAIGSLNANNLLEMPRKFSIQTKQKSNIDEIILNLNNKFDITNAFELKQFITNNPVQTIEKFGIQLKQVTDMVVSFLDTVSSGSKNKIDIFKDEEINNFQSISMECYVKGSNGVQCIKWTDEIIEKIIEIDEKILNVLQIEIIPYE